MSPEDQPTPERTEHSDTTWPAEGNATPIFRKRRRFDIRIMRARKKTEFFVRIVYPNGKKFSSTETYKRRASAMKAVDALVTAIKNNDYIIIQEK